MGDDRIAYEETTPWPAWAALIVLVAFSSALFAGASELETTLTIMLPCFVGIWLLFGRLRVQVTSSGLIIGFGFIPLVRKHVDSDDVVEIEAVEYRPIREFGGWGIRFGRGGKRAWTIRGNRALCLELTDGKKLYVGSDKPERLGQRVRMAWGRPPSPRRAAEAKDAGSS